MMADFARSTDFGVVVRYSTAFSLFGAYWLAWFLATISQFAINDGNYYEAVNAFQNIIGGWRKWKRLYTCFVCAAIGALAGWLVNYEITNGFLKVAAFLAVTAPSATTIMCVDHFLLPRLFGISRPLLEDPRDGVTPRSATGPRSLALAIAVLFGAWATGIVPGENANRYWGPAPLLAWALGGVLYIVFVWADARAGTQGDAAQASAWVLRGGDRRADAELRDRGHGHRGREEQRTSGAANAVPGHGGRIVDIERLSANGRVGERPGRRCHYAIAPMSHR